MSSVLNRSVDQEGQCLIEIGIGENHLRGFATEFKRDWNRTLGSGGLHKPTYFWRTCEGKMLNARVVQQSSSGFFAKSGDDVQGPCWKARFNGKLSEVECRLGRFLSGLEDTGVAHRQRSADSASNDLHRVVPRDDVAGDTMRFTDGQNGVAL